MPCWECCYYFVGMMLVGRPLDKKRTSEVDKTLLKIGWKQKKTLSNKLHWIMFKLSLMSVITVDGVLYPVKSNSKTIFFTFTQLCIHSLQNALSKTVMSQSIIMQVNLCKSSNFFKNKLHFCIVSVLEWILVRVWSDGGRNSKE